MTARTRFRVRILATASLVLGIALLVAGALVVRQTEQRPASNDRPSATPAPNASSEPASPSVDPEQPTSSEDRPSREPTPPTQAPNDGIDSFDECVAAGHPVAESHPRQCFADGRGFTEDE